MVQLQEAVSDEDEKWFPFNGSCRLGSIYICFEVWHCKDQNFCLCGCEEVMLCLMLGKTKPKGMRM